MIKKKVKYFLDIGKKHKKIKVEKGHDMEVKFRKLIQVIAIAFILPFPLPADDDSCEGSYCDRNPTAEECIQCPERPGCPGGEDEGDYMDITLSE